MATHCLYLLVEHDNRHAARQTPISRLGFRRPVRHAVDTSHSRNDYRANDAIFLSSDRKHRRVSFAFIEQGGSSSTLIGAASPQCGLLAPPSIGGVENRPLSRPGTTRRNAPQLTDVVDPVTG